VYNINEAINMKKFEDGRIGFNSTLEHRLVERLRGKLKSKGYVVEIVFNNHKNTVIFEATKDENKKTIYGQFRTIETDNVSMNRKFYDIENLKRDPNTFVVLIDRRHLYPMKFTQFINIKNVICNDSAEPHVLFQESEFRVL
jgi:hypothetical protein